MSLKLNVTANFAGSLWLALMSLAFVPFYIRLMGVESYGIVGVLVSLQAIFALLDLGLSQTMMREMARLSAYSSNAGQMDDTARTFEIIYWSLALAVTTILALLAHFIAFYWLNPDQLTRETLREALWIMASVVGLRWPIALYTGGLNGLQRQVLVNALLAIFATLQGLGALGVLWFIAPTVQTFFWWQALVALIQVAVFRIALLRSLPTRRRGTFKMAVLKETWRFAAGVTGIALLATLLTQLDKVLLSKILSLPDFGYYVFATTVAAALFRLVTPVSTAYSPRLTELVSTNNHSDLVSVYHQGCQVMAVVIIAPALTLAVFSKEILTLWTRNPDLVAGTHLLVSLLAIGNMLNGLLAMPYALQLAHGWTKLAFYINVSAVLFLVPAMYFATVSQGAVGAASVWLALNCCYVLVGMHIMYRRFLKSEKWHWYERDVGRPLLAVLLIVIVARMVMIDEWGAFVKFVILVTVLGLSAAAAALSVESTRANHLLVSLIRTRWRKKYP